MEDSPSSWGPTSSIVFNSRESLFVCSSRSMQKSTPPLTGVLRHNNATITQISRVFFLYYLFLFKWVNRIPFHTPTWTLYLTYHEHKPVAPSDLHTEEQRLVCFQWHIELLTKKTSPAEKERNCIIIIILNNTPTTRQTALITDSNQINEWNQVSKHNIKAR